MGCSLVAEFCILDGTKDSNKTRIVGKFHFGFRVHKLFLPKKHISKYKKKTRNKILQIRFHILCVRKVIGEKSIFFMARVKRQKKMSREKSNFTTKFYDFSFYTYHKKYRFFRETSSWTHRILKYIRIHLFLHFLIF